MKKSIKILTLSVILILKFNFSFAYSNYDECNILWESIEDNFAKLSLDEPFLTSENRFGIAFDRNDDNTRSIISIHQELADEIYENYEQANLYFSNVTKINGKDVNNLTDEEFDGEFEGEQIKIEVHDYENLFVFDKKNYESIIIDDVILDLHDVSSINTKSSQFDANFTVHSAWRDNRYIDIAHSIYTEKPGNESGGFFCRFDIEDIDKSKLFYPKLIPQRFITKRDDIFRTFEFHYEPQPETLCNEGVYFDNCSELELSRGIAYFELKENYLGTINDEFPVHNFPFDHQWLRFNIHPDRGHNFFYETQFNTTDYSSTFLSNAVQNLYSPEWEFSDWSMNMYYQIDPASDQFYSTLNFDYKIERKNLYYTFKLMIPVIFLIVLSGMVFFIKMDDLQSRLTISVVCFLSLIAYIFVVDDELPKLGYLTFIDIFILISYMFSGLPTLQTVLVEQLNMRGKNKLSLNFDRYFRRFYFAGYILSLIILLQSFELLVFSGA